MHSRTVIAGFLIALVSFTLSVRAAAQGTWAVENTFHVGGDGGMDYITLDAQNHRLYVPRSTHTMVIDADSGKTIADIPGRSTTMELLWRRKPAGIHHRRRRLSRYLRP